MRTIKAQFDGRVLVPKEPVDLPLNQELTVYIEPAANAEAPLAELVQVLSELPDNPHTPTDLAAQHDHYLHGLPKRP